jgi:hypothetical protein
MVERGQEVDSRKEQEKQGVQVKEKKGADKVK